MTDPRTLKFESLNNHAWYRKHVQSLSEKDRAWVRDFLQKNQTLDNDVFTAKVNRLFIDGEKPKNCHLLCEILLASRP